MFLFVSKGGVKTLASKLRTQDTLMLNENTVAHEQAEVASRASEENDDDQDINRLTFDQRL